MDRASGFLTYTEDEELIDMLSDADAGRLYKALLAYQARGEETDLPPTARLMFALYKRKIDANNERYTKKCERNRENGQKGGRPPKKAPQAETQDNPVGSVGFTENPKNLNTNTNTNTKDILIDYSSIVDDYNLTCVSLPKVKTLTDKRKKRIRSRMKNYTADDIHNAFVKAEQSDFLSGRNGNWNGCNLDWLLNENNLIKVLEGNYDNKKGGAKQSWYDFAVAYNE